jgi:5-methyltetrahydrofolate--homocysteine methyltransferase
MTDFGTISQALVDGDEDKVMRLVRQGLEAGVPAADLLNQGLIPGMDAIGDRMESGDMFIPEVLMAAQLMSRAVETLKPLLADGASSARGQVVIGTVKGDLHDIGKNLVAMMIESSGMEVHNLGVDIAPAQFVAAIRDKKAHILCLSALLTTTMPMMRDTVAAIEESGLREQVKIMVGGAPVTQGFADEIGADGWAPDAGSAVKLAKRLMA